MERLAGGNRFFVEKLPKVLHSFAAGCFQPRLGDELYEHDEKAAKAASCTGFRTCVS